MHCLVFPDRVTIHARLVGDEGETRAIGFPIAFSIRTFARSKNDYHLGPFFSDHTGVLALTRRQLELSAQAKLSSGLMDYASVHDGFPLIEISHFSADDIERAIIARKTHWTDELEGEHELYGSVAKLVASYRGVRVPRNAGPEAVRVHIPHSRAQNGAKGFAMSHDRDLGTPRQLIARASGSLRAESLDNVDARGAGGREHRRGDRGGQQHHR